MRAVGAAAAAAASVSPTGEVHGVVSAQVSLAGSDDIRRRRCGCTAHAANAMSPGGLGAECRPFGLDACDHASVRTASFPGAQCAVKRPARITVLYCTPHTRSAMHHHKPLLGTHLDARAGLPLFGGPPAVVVSRADLQQHQQQQRWSTRLPCNTHHQRPTANSHHHHHLHQPTARLVLSPPRGSTLQKALPRHAPPQAQRQDGRPAWTEQPSPAAPAAGPSQPARRT